MIYTNITLRLNVKKQTLVLFIFLLTCFFNNLNATTLVVFLDSNSVVTNVLEDEIKQFADDSIKLSIDGKTALLYGNARIEYQETSISASIIKIDWIKNTITASFTTDSLGEKSGLPVFKEKNDSFIADHITYNFKTKKCSVKKIRTKEGEGFILGKTVKKVDDNIFYLKKGDYTTCDAEKPHFSIRANRIKIIPNNKIITGPAYLTFFNIPTPLILPFGYFPNNDKKSSGLIFPSYGESATLGFFLKDGGYYFTINDKIDLSLKSDIYSQGSWNIKSQLRYKNRYKNYGNLNIHYGNMKNSYFGFPDYSEKRDFYVRWSHKQDQKANPSFSFSANVELGSSSYHRNNSYNDNDYLKNTMSSNINLSKAWSDAFFNNLNLSFRHSQNISNNNINLTLPELSLNSKRIYPFKLLTKSQKSTWYNKISIKYDLSAKNTISTVDSLLFNKKSLEGFRNGMSHNIPINSSIRLLKYINLNSSINLRERWYLNQISKKWNQDESLVEIDTLNKFTRAHDYSFTTGLNTKIYGIAIFNKGKIAGIKHVITPSISFRYTPDFSDEKYGYYKTVQTNELGNTQQYSIMQNGLYGSPTNNKFGNINFSLGNILDLKIRKRKDTITKIKKIKLIESFSINSSYNIFSDSLNLSNIRISARNRFLNIIDLTFSADYDPYIANSTKTNRVNKFEINTNYRLARLKYFTTSLGLNISDKSFKSNAESNEDSDEESRDFYNIPWNINANYSLRYDKGHSNSNFADTTQSLTISGNFKITKKWKIGFRSGYDFKDKKLTYSSIDIYRDLHCWEMLFNWIPLGYHKSYTLTIRVKADVLKDLKYENKKDWFTPEFN